MPIALTTDIDLVHQLFPFSIATLPESTSVAHRALGNIYVPSFTGEDVYAVYKNLQTRLRSLVAFAYSPKRKLYENAIANATPEIVKLAFLIKHFELALAGYPGKLDLSFLQWPKVDTNPKLPLPAFMALDINKPSFSMICRKQTPGWRQPPNISLEFKPLLPQEVQQQFQVFQPTLVNALGQDDGTCYISAQFSGSPPPATDQKIDKAKVSRLITQVLIFAEVVGDWEMNKVIEVKDDPIVCGVSPVYHPVTKLPIGNHFSFVDIFYPTKPEELALQKCRRELPDLHTYS